MFKKTQTLLLVLIVLGSFTLTSCKPDKQLVYEENLLLKTENTEEFFSKIQSVIPASNGDLAFRYEAGGEGFEGMQILKYLSPPNYEYDSKPHYLIENIIPLTKKEVIYTTTDLEGNENLYKKHQKIYEGSIKDAQVDNQENLYFIGVEDNENILYIETDYEAKEIERHTNIKNYDFDSEGNIAIVYKEREMEGWKIKYKDFESEEIYSIDEIAISKEDNFGYIAKDKEGIKKVTIDGKEFTQDRQVEQIGHFRINNQGSFAFSAKDSETGEWLVITKKDEYLVDGQIKKISLNNYNEIAVIYRDEQGYDKVKIIGEKEDRDSAIQILDVYLDDSENLTYLKKGDMGEWQLVINGEILERFVRLERFYYRDNKVYLAGEKTNGDIVFIELSSTN